MYIINARTNLTTASMHLIGPIATHKHVTKLQIQVYNATIHNEYTSI